MIAILGAGKMGEALLSGMLRAGVAPSGVIAAVRRPERAEALHDSYGIDVTSAGEAAGKPDTLVITLKAPDMAGLLEGIAPPGNDDQPRISAAAGVFTKTVTT